MAKTLAPARNALIGLHLDQQVILAWKSQAGKLLTWRTHVIGNADVMSLNGSDFHVFLLVCFRARGGERRRANFEMLSDFANLR
jgi:hypothetical protein